MTNYICIGVPFFVGEHIEGRNEIEKLRASGLAEAIGAEWHIIQPDFETYANPVIAVNRALAQAIQAHTDKTPLIFASCCTPAVGALKGLEAHNPAMIWIDAHGDFNTTETSPSGFLGGMPLAWVVGDGDQTIVNGVGLTPIDAHNIILTDARDLDPPEAERLQNSAITHLTDIRDLLTADLPQKPVYIHFDTDVLTLDDMPGMSFPATGGPSLTNALEVIRHLKQNVTIAGVLFSVWNDLLPTEGKALDSTIKLAKAFAQP